MRRTIEKAAILSVAAIATPVLASPADPDPSFGTMGETATPASETYQQPTSVVTDRQGRLYVLVTRQVPTAPLPGGSLTQLPINVSPLQFQIQRFTHDGQPDLSFATNGTLTLNLGSVTPVGLVVDESGQKLILAGGTDLGIGGGVTSVGAFQASVSRIGLDGTLDASFGSSGTAILPVATISQGDAVAVQSDGRILVAGHGSDTFVARFNASGTIDSTFGSDGVMHLAGAGGRSKDVAAIRQDAGGNIYFCGPAQYDATPSGVSYTPAGVVVGRLGPDGTPVATFGDAGAKEIDFGFRAACLDIRPGRDGRFAVAGATNGSLTVASLKSDGTLDTSFEGTGLTSGPLTNLYPMPAHATAQDDGKLVLVESGGSISAGGTDIPLFSPMKGGVLATRVQGSEQLLSASQSSSSGDSGGGGALDPRMLFAFMLALALTLLKRRTVDDAASDNCSVDR